MQVNLKAARDAKGWTLETLAQKSGVNKSTISRLERGQTLPMHDTVKVLEDALSLKRGSLVFKSSAKQRSAA